MLTICRSLSQPRDHPRSPGDGAALCHHLGREPRSLAPSITLVRWAAEVQGSEDPCLWGRRQYGRWRKSPYLRYRCYDFCSRLALVPMPVSTLLTMPAKERTYTSRVAPGHQTHPNTYAAPFLAADGRQTQPTSPESRPLHPPPPAPEPPIAHVHRAEPATASTAAPANPSNDNTPATATKPQPPPTLTPTATTPPPSPPPQRPRPPPRGLRHPPC